MCSFFYFPFLPFLPLPPLFPKCDSIYLSPSLQSTLHILDPFSSSSPPSHFLSFHSIALAATLHTLSLASWHRLWHNNIILGWPRRCPARHASHCPEEKVESHNVNQTLAATFFYPLNSSLRRLDFCPGVVTYFFLEKCRTEIYWKVSHVLKNLLNFLKMSWKSIIFALHTNFPNTEVCLNIHERNSRFTKHFFFLKSGVSPHVLGGKKSFTHSFATPHKHVAPPRAWHSGSMQEGKNGVGTLKAHTAREVKINNAPRVGMGGCENLNLL